MDNGDYAYLYDGKGNVAAVIDSSQAVVAAYRYAPFGKLLVKTGSLTQPFGFSTKRYDEQTGLIHYGYRFYGPEIGRWTTRDPLGEAGGMNLYAFVGNNPVNWVDPWGLQTDAATMQQIALGGGGLLTALGAVGGALTTSVSVLGAAAIGPAIAAGAFGWGVGTYINETWVEPWLWNEDTAADDDTCPSPPPPTSSTEEHDQRNKEQIQGDIDDLMDKEAEILNDYPDQPLGRTRGRIEKWLKDWTKK